MTTLIRTLRRINDAADWIGKITSMLVFPLIAMLLWEVFMRYVVNRPTVWAHELSALVYAVYFLMGGSYAFRWRSHINVEIIYNRLPSKVRAALDLVTWLLFYLFIGITFWLGLEFAWNSIVRMETSNTVWAPYIWPVKVFLPISALLMLILGVSKSIADIVFLLTGHRVFKEDEELDELKRTEVEL